MSPSDPAANAVDPAAKRWTIWLTSAATFMLILDVTVVNVALPDMERTLHAQLTDLEWVVDAYSLALGTFLLISGSIADRVGRRRTYLAGITIFTLGSLGSSLAGSPVMLIVLRFVQGVGGAALFATGPAIIAHAFRGRERGRALGIWGAAIGAGLAVGPLIGGVLTDAFGWPSIFLVNVPLGVLMFALTWWRMPESKAQEPPAPDRLGFAIFGLSLFLLVFGLVEGNRLGWGSPIIIGPLAGAVAFGAVFLHRSRREEALFDIRLLRDRGFLAATVAVIGQGIVIASVMLFLLRDLQEVGGASPLVAGAEMLPMTITAFVAAIAAGRLAGRWHPGLILSLSLLLLAGGLGLLLLSDPAGSPLLLFPGLIVAGLGWGSTNPIAASASLDAVSPDAAGRASGFNNTSRQIGIAAGIGSLGAMFVARTAAVVSSGLHGLGPRATARIAHLAALSGLRVAQAEAPRSVRPELVSAARDGMTSGLHAVELVAAVLALLVGIAVLAIAVTDRAGREERAGTEAARAA